MLQAQLGENCAMPDHIGIVACSAPGAALCYETICAEAQELLGPHEHPEISLHAYSFAEYVHLLEAGDWDGVGRLLVQSATKLASIGARFAICPDNTAHQAMEYVKTGSPIPWLHIAEVVVREAVRTGAKRLGILGTRYLMEGPVYPEKLAAANLEWRVPPPPDREVINRIIFEELVLGRLTEEARSQFERIIEELRRAESCDAILLGCTELPLAITPEMSQLPLFDSTRLLARAAIRRSVERETTP
jgi:aspartate racemase